MRSKKVTLAIPNRLWDALEQHAREVGYSDARQFLVWCGFYSLLVQKPHTITAPIAQSSLEIQDEIIDQVVSAYERGEMKKGSYFEALLADVIQRLGVTMPAEVIRAVVAESVRNRPRKSP